MRQTDSGNDTGNAGEKGFQIHATKQNVIEYKVNAPSKSMSMN